MKRRARSVEIDRIVAGNDELCLIESDWIERGYVRAGVRAWACRDHTITVRLVWRKRGAALSTVTCVMRGLPA